MNNLNVSRFSLQFSDIALRVKKRQMRNTRRLLLLVVAATAPAGSAFAGVLDTFTAGTLLDIPSDWSLNSVPSSANDALIGPTFPTTSTTVSFNSSTSTSQSFGSLNITNPNLVTIQNSIPNTTVTLTLGNSANANSDAIAGAAPGDLLYVGPNSGMNMNSPIGVATKPYGTLLVNLAQSGNFDVAGTATIQSVTTIGNFTLTKTGVGSLNLSGGIAAGSGGVNAMAGTLSFSNGTNYFSGNLTIFSSATVTFSSTFNLPTSSTVILNGGTLVNLENSYSSTNFARSIVLNSGTSTIGVMSTGFVGGQLNLTQALTGAGNLIVGGSIVNTGQGPGTIGFGVSNSYTGTTTVPIGKTLSLDNAGSSPASALTLGGGRLAIEPTHSSTSLIFTSVTLGVGASSIASDTSYYNTAPSTLTANLSIPAITRSVGGTLDFVLPTSNAFTTPTADTTGTILAGFATANNQTTWAVSGGDGTNAGAISALSTFGSNYATATAATDFDATASGAFTSSGIDSLRFNTSGAMTVTLNGAFNVGSGGILVTANVGAGGTTIAGGLSLTSGNGADLIVHQYNPTATLTIDTSITGGIGLTKAGPATLILDAPTESYTGTTYITAGVLQVGNNDTNGSLGTGPVVDNGTLEFNRTDSAGFTVASSVSGSGGVLQAGSGQIKLNNTNTYTGSTVINSGSVVLGVAGSLPAGTNLTIGTGTLLTANSVGTAYALQVGTLNISNGTLNLTNNDLIVHSGTLSAINALVQSGFNNGHWNGSTGIVSSSAGISNRLMALGTIVNDNGQNTNIPLYGSSGTIAGTFGAATPVDGDILVKYTYYGDANLDGKVDGSDYSLIDNGYLNKLTGWLNGDFNYDGVINGSDYTLIDNAFNTQSAAVAIEIATPTAQIAKLSAVPEPTATEILGVGAMSLLGRRRRIRGVAVCLGGPHC